MPEHPQAVQAHRRCVSESPGCALNLRELQGAAAPTAIPKHCYSDAKLRSCVQKRSTKIAELPRSSRVPVNQWTKAGTGMARSSLRLPHLPAAAQSPRPSRKRTRGKGGRRRHTASHQQPPGAAQSRIPARTPLQSMRTHSSSSICIAAIIGWISLHQGNSVQAQPFPQAHACSRQLTEEQSQRDSLDVGIINF